MNRQKLLYSISGLLLPVFIFSCNQAGNSKDQLIETANPPAANVSTPVIDTMFAGEKDITILVKDGEAFIKGHLVANKTRPTYTLPVWKDHHVTAVLKPLKKDGNVRISQVQQPDGTLDGPFGDSVNCKIESNGNLRFIIGENLMTGERYTGDFLLHVKVE